jgi:hypothetical protein
MANPEQSAEELFGAALDLAPERRTAFLDQACHDPKLRHLVEELLVQNDRVGSFLAKPLFTPHSQSDSSSGSFPTRFQLAAGTKVSRYSIIAPIGYRGMGVIYKAKDSELARFVAFKFLPHAPGQDPQALERLRREALRNPAAYPRARPASRLPIEAAHPSQTRIGFLAHLASLYSDMHRPVQNCRL